MGKPLKDEIGNTYNLLTVIGRGSNKGTRASWLCRCACGNPELVTKSGDQLRSGKAISCGCTRNPYSAEEDSYLLANYATTSKAELAKHLGRSIKSIEKHMLTVLKTKKTMEQMGTTRRSDVSKINLAGREKYRGRVPDEWLDLPASFLEAEKLGAERLFSGKPCSRGHVSPRRVDNKACLECIKEDDLARRKSGEFKDWRKAYRSRAEVRASEREIRRRRMADPVFKFRVNMSARISAAMRAGRVDKPAETQKLLGIAWEEFKDWIQGQLQEGMTLENYGQWHLDHVRPCSSFDLGSQEQCYVAFNWRNYQPLWGDENLEKNDTYSESDEAKWTQRMRDLAYTGDLFLRYVSNSVPPPTPTPHAKSPIDQQ